MRSSAPPTASVGYMNGGIDFAISKHLGWHLEQDLQRIIREKYYGELLVGQAEILATGHAQFPYLIAAPTMRTPMTSTCGPNVYQSMKAVLLLLRHGRLATGELVGERVQRVAVPGLGTGIGRVLLLVEKGSQTTRQSRNAPPLAAVGFPGLAYLWG
jgi:O-acetyl-ADP-ribose deacetylase (regulator of RNase III)